MFENCGLTPEEQAAATEAFREYRREKTKEWQRRHPEKRKIYNARYWARRAAHGGPLRGPKRSK